MNRYPTTGKLSNYNRNLITGMLSNIDRYLTPGTLSNRFILHSITMVIERL
jgi:hypothetical protein